MRGCTYLVDGVTALDGTGVAVTAAEHGGRGSRKDGESEEREGGDACEHSECEGWKSKE